MAMCSKTSFSPPGLWAAVLQLCRGTKYKRFPGCLDHWMCRRKQLGLLSFLCAGLHAVYSMCLTLRRAAGYRLLNAAYQQVRSHTQLLFYLTDCQVLQVVDVCVGLFVLHVRDDGFEMQQSVKYK